MGAENGHAEFRTQIGLGAESRHAEPHTQVGLRILERLGRGPDKTEAANTKVARGAEWQHGRRMKRGMRTRRHSCAIREEPVRKANTKIRH